jgi:hypothetical protein
VFWVALDKKGNDDCLAGNMPNEMLTDLVAALKRQWQGNGNPKAKFGWSYLYRETGLGLPLNEGSCFCDRQWSKNNSQFENAQRFGAFRSIDVPCLGVRCL